MLGLGLAAGVLWASHAFLLSLASGLEVCGRCGVERDSERVGPFWFRSQVRPARSPGWRERGVAPCAEHDWKRSGCWKLDGGYHYLAPVGP